MLSMVKLKCLLCGGVYYIIDFDYKLQLLEALLQGEALPATCPFCCNDVHAVLLKRIRLTLTEL